MTIFSAENVSSVLLFRFLFFSNKKSPFTYLICDLEDENLLRLILLFHVYVHSIPNPLCIKCFVTWVHRIQSLYLKCFNQAKAQKKCEMSFSCCDVMWFNHFHIIYSSVSVSENSEHSKCLEIDFWSKPLIYLFNPLLCWNCWFWLRWQNLQSVGCVSSCTRNNFSPF